MYLQQKYLIIAWNRHSFTQNIYYFMNKSKVRETFVTVDTLTHLSYREK